MSERVDYVVAGLGALGSASAMELAGRGHSVIGLERFELGHSNGASHDTSRILRHSYHTPAYVRLTEEAYDDWARLERASGEHLVTKVGGLDLFPEGAAIPAIDYTTSMDEVGIAYELLDAATVMRRWPQFALPDGTSALFQRDGAIVPAGRGTATMQELARRRGADLRGESPVTHVRDLGDAVEVTTPHGTIVCGGLVVTADAWTNQVLRGLDLQVPLEVTLEQVTYFEPDEPARFDSTAMPLWIWMDDPSFYGFPCYGEATVKAAQDCGGPTVDPDRRTHEPDEAMRDLLTDHVRRMLPGVGRPVRSLRCQYTLTPDRDFVVAAVPGHPSVVVGLGAGHGFKFGPTFGRMLADLAESGTTTSDVAAFGLDRPGLVDPDYQAQWLV